MFDLTESRSRQGRRLLSSAIVLLMIAIAAFVTDHRRLSDLFMIAYGITFLSAMYIRYRKPR
jgi:hypothetical protein